MNILIADDHAVLRQGLKHILADEFPDARFGEASDTRETLELLDREPWDVLVLDIFMPGRNGLDALAQVRRSFPLLPVLVLSSAPEEQLALRVLKAGASGYLNKQAAPDELVAAVRHILTGGRYVSQTLGERLAFEIAQPDHPPHETLSDREFAVLQLLVTGRSIKEIAASLSLSPKTVSTFHIRIWEKLRVQNDIEMVRYALEHRLVEASPKAPPPPA